MSILDGRYFEYSSNGSLKFSGSYVSNKKGGDWISYDDTGKVVNFLKYSNDSLVKIVDLNAKDTTQIDEKNAKEATFPGGYKAWSRYLLTELEKDNPANKSFQGGNVVVNFVVDKDGSIVDVFLSKSAEFILDQRALQIVTASKKWEPAIINGKTVRAYRRQPFTFLQE